MMSPLSPGTRLHGYCGGAFGRDGYGEKLVIASGVWDGRVWAVVEMPSSPAWLGFTSGVTVEDAASWLVPDETGAYR